MPKQKATHGPCWVPKSSEGLVGRLKVFAANKKKPVSRYTKTAAEKSAWSYLKNRYKGQRWAWKNMAKEGNSEPVLKAKIRRVVNAVVTNRMHKVKGKKWAPICNHVVYT